jgi:hypothetical protein
VSEALILATSIARHGFAREWPIEDCRDEIIERLLIPPWQADHIVLAVLREKQEQDIVQAHAEIAYDAIRYYE